MRTGVGLTKGSKKITVKLISPCFFKLLRQIFSTFATEVVGEEKAGGGRGKKSPGVKCRKGQNYFQWSRRRRRRCRPPRRRRRRCHCLYFKQEELWCHRHRWWKKVLRPEDGKTLKVKLSHFSCLTILKNISSESHRFPTLWARVLNVSP